MIVYYNTTAPDTLLIAYYNQKNQLEVDYVNENKEGKAYVYYQYTLSDLRECILNGRVKDYSYDFTDCMILHDDGID